MLIAEEHVKLIVVESPYGSDDQAEIDANVKYVRRCMSFVFDVGHAPYASHDLYTHEGVLRDEVPEERTKGMEAGYAWGAKADEVWFFMDRGFSGGMAEGMRRAMRHGKPMVFWFLDAEGGPRSFDIYDFAACFHRMSHAMVEFFGAALAVDDG